MTRPKVVLQPLGCIVLNVRFTTNRMCAKNNTIYMWHEQAIIEWSWWVTSNNACETSQQLIVLINGDDNSVLYCCLLPQCEALRTFCSGFPTATVAQRIQVVSILLHEAKHVLRLFCLHLNTIDWSGHVSSTIRRDNWLGFKSLWLWFRISAYGQDLWSCLWSCFRFSGSVFRVGV